MKLIWTLGRLLQRGDHVLLIRQGTGPNLYTISRIRKDGNRVTVGREQWFISPEEKIFKVFFHKEDWPKNLYSKRKRSHETIKGGAYLASNKK